MTNDIQIREIFHFLFLQSLLKISDPKLYILKGGVNLRFFFGSPRYSEDMDLDVRGTNVETLRKNGYKILNDGSFLRSLEAFGVADLMISDPSKAKHTMTTQRFKVQLSLKNGVNLPTKVEFSRRENFDEASVTEVISPELARTYRRLSFPVQHYGGESAVLQKVRALAGRDTPQARDVFDLQILWLGGFAKRGYIINNLPDNLRKKAAETVLSLSYEQYLGQVLEFIADDQKQNFSSDEDWNAMCLRILDLLGYG